MREMESNVAKDNLPAQQRRLFEEIRKTKQYVKALTKERSSAAGRQVILGCSILPIPLYASLRGSAITLFPSTVVHTNHYLG